MIRPPRPKEKRAVTGALIQTDASDYSPQYHEAPAVQACLAWWQRQADRLFGYPAPLLQCPRFDEVEKHLSAAFDSITEAIEAYRDQKGGAR